MARPGMRTRSTVWRYGVAVLAVGAAVPFMLVWRLFVPGPGGPAAPLFAAILLTGWYAGTGPVILATILAVLTYDVVVYERLLYSPAADRESNLRLAWFTAFSGLAAWFSANRRRMAAALESAQEDLERQVAERTTALRRSEEYLLQAQELSHTGNWAWNVATGKVIWSEQCSRIAGRDLTNITRAMMSEIIHPDDQARYEREADVAVRTKAPFDHQFRVVRPDGSIRYVRCSGKPVLDPGGGLVEIMGVVTDMTDLEEATRALLDERARLARDLHDTLLQGFTAVGLNLVAVVNRMKGPPDTVAALRDVIANAQQTLADARQAVWDIRPPVSTGQDFVTALRAAAEAGVRGTAVTLEFVATGEARPADSEGESTIVRVTQEALANVVKHAAAHTARVVLRYDRTGIRLTVTDDGRGFVVDPDLAADGRHLGLLGMRERATRARGTLTVRSSPGQGTEIVLLVPALPERGIAPAKGSAPS